MEHASQKTERVPEEPADNITPAAERYVKHLWWPTLIAGIFEISALFHPNEFALVTAANAALVVLAIFYTRKERDDWNTAVVVAAISGAAGAMLMQLAELFSNFQIIFIFKLFTQTAIIAVFDAIAAGVLFIIVQSLGATKKPDAPEKGGDDNG